MTMSKKRALVGVVGALIVASVMGQLSCVQLNNTDFSSCPCGDASLTFTLEGETSVAMNTVNLAIILDGSGSINPKDFALEQGFAVDTVAAFAARNLFENGGEASYVQYSSTLVSSGTFTSAQDFIEFSAADVQERKGTTTSVGIKEGRKLLGTNPASASFMIVITDGRSNSMRATAAAADAARAEGILVFAVGVGSATGDAELLAIGGDAGNVFEVADFDLLDAVLERILSSGGGTTIACPSTGAMVTIDFSVPVACAPAGTVSKRRVTFSAPDIEANATVFDVILDLCSVAPGAGIIESANYTDDQGNTPDLSLLIGLMVGNDACVPPVTPEPSRCLPECPTKTHPERGEHLKFGSAINSTYLGCYVDEAQQRALNDTTFKSDNMTTQMCADICSSSGYKFFGTAYSSDCHCGACQPTSGDCVCNYKCSGDTSTACGGVGCISLFRSDD